MQTETRYIGCGCSEFNPCDNGFDACYWLRTNHEAAVGVCSECEEHVERFDHGDYQPEYDDVGDPEFDEMSNWDELAEA